MRFVLRMADPPDLPFINAIYNHYVLHSTCTYQTTPVTDEERLHWYAEHQRSGGRFPILIAQEIAPVHRILGWGSLNPFHARAGYRFTAENSIYVRHDCHRQGIGRALLADLIFRADALGYRSVIAAISGDQAPSIALHATQGFKDVGCLESAGFKFDRWLNVLYMQRMRP